MSATPLMTVDTMHKEMVHDAQLDYYSRKLATASSDRTVEIFDVSDKGSQRTAVLTGHEGPVWQIAWAHPKFGVLLASCSYDGSVLIHREAPVGVWTLIHAHRLHESSVNGISWAPHELGLILACASSDGKVSILKYEDDGWQASHFYDSKLGCNSVSWAPHNSVGGRDASGQEYMRLVTGSCDNKVRIWRCPVNAAASGQLSSWTNELRDATEHGPHTDWVRDVAWAPATGMPCSMIASCSEDKQVYIWTQTEGSDTSWTPALMHTFQGPVWRVSWSITGNVLAVSHGDDDVTLWKQNIQGQWEQVSSVADAGDSPAGQQHMQPY